MKPKVLVFASGSKDGGGSGFLHLILNMLAGVLPVEIVGVVSNHANGGVKMIADKYQIPFFFFSVKGRYSVERREEFLAEYRRIVNLTSSEWFLLSGWLKFVVGLDPTHTINIHPGPTKDFGGDGMHGDHVHAAIVKARAGDDSVLSAVTMHFVTEAGYDLGPTFFEYPLWVEEDDNADSLGDRVNRYEHGHQSLIYWLVIRGQISWSGHKGDEVQVPDWYRLMPFCPQRLRVGV